MPEALTPLERQVYHYLIDFLAENTYQPSIREIAKQFRIKSTKTVSDLLHGLTDKGYIERDQSRSRGVRILGFASAGQVRPVPVRDPASAGLSERQRYITLDRRFLASDDATFVRAADAGASARGILEGDYVIVTPLSSLPSDGALVVVQRNGTAVVRIARDLHGAVVYCLGDGRVDDALSGDATLLGAAGGVFRPFFEDLAATVPAPETAIVPEPATMPPMPVAIS